MLVSLKEPPFRSTGAGNSTVSKVKQVGQKTKSGEQGTPCGAQEEKEIVESLEAGLGFAGRLQSCGSYLQEEDTKSKAQLELKLARVVSDNKTF